MGEYKTTLIACCCACECEQFPAMSLVVSASGSMDFVDADSGVSHYEVSISSELEFDITYDQEAEPACLQLIHDAEDAPETCRYSTTAVDASVITGCNLAAGVAFTYPDPDIAYGLGENSTDKTVTLDLEIVNMDITVDCEGNGTLTLNFILDGDAGEIDEVQDAIAGFTPILDGTYQIPITLVNWQGTYTATTTLAETPPGWSGTNTISATAEFIVP
jgi:hypothetical protein